MSHIEKEAQHCELNKQQKLLILQTRLALEADFRIFRNNVEQKTELWKKIQQQLTEKDINMKDLTRQKIQISYKEMLAAYETMKTTGAVKGTWEREMYEMYEMFEKAFADDQFRSSSSKSALKKEIYQLVLDARLCRESEFKKNDQNERTLLWQKILEEVKAKAVGCTEHLTSRRIQSIFYNMCYTYKREKRNKSMSSWPYFDQMHKIYGHNDKELTLRKVGNFNDELKQLVLNARLCREAEFKQFPFKRPLLWQEILCEVKAKTVGCTEDITIRQMQLMFNNMVRLYKRQTSLKRRSFEPYFDLMHKVYGNDEIKIKLKKPSIDNSKLKQLVLNARLARDAEFKKYSTKNTFQRTKLWQEIFCEVKAKAAGYCTVELNRQKIQRIFTNLYNSYIVHKRNGTGSSWPYFHQIDKIYRHDGNEEKLKLCSIEYRKLEQLVLIARLSRDAEFKKYPATNAFERKKLWQEILCEVKAKAADCCTVELNRPRMQSIFRNLDNSYRVHKRNGTGNTWPYFEQMNKIYGHDDKKLKSRKVNNLNNELKQLVLDARLCREAKFQQFKACAFKRKLLWQEIWCEVKAKAVGCTELITKRQMQLIFHSLHRIYKKQKNQKTKSSWPYFEQMNKVYGNDKIKIKLQKPSINKSKLEQLVLNARLSREAEFQKFFTKNSFERNKLWQEILCEVELKAADFCTEELNSVKIQQIFKIMLYKYKKHKNNGNRSWQYFEQMDKVYGNCEPFEIFTMNSHNENVECNNDSITVTSPTLSAVAIAPIVKLLKKKAFCDREIFQQICNIETNKLQLQRAEIDELRKLIIILKTKHEQ